MTQEEIDCNLTDDLYQKAINYYLDKTDFDPCEWLENKDKIKYIEAKKRLGEWD